MTVLANPARLAQEAIAQALKPPDPEKWAVYDAAYKAGASCEELKALHDELWPPATPEAGE